MSRSAPKPAPVGDFSQALRRGPLREAGVYLAAATTVLAVHAGVAAWAMRARPEPLSDIPPAGEAVMIDLAPEPAAPIDEQTQITNQQQDAPPTETDPLETPTTLDEVQKVDTPDPVEDAPPPDEIAEDVPEIEELAQPDLPEIDTAEAVVPVKPKVKPVEKPKEKKPAPPKAAPPKESVRETAQRPAQAAAGSKEWQSRLMAHLERRKRRLPPARGGGSDAGVAKVFFTIDTSGNVLSARLVRSSGVQEFDAEALALVRRASPVPAPPPGAKLDISVPVTFDVR